MYAALRRVVEAQTRPGDRVMIVATSVSPASPMLLKIGRHRAAVTCTVSPWRWSMQTPSWRRAGRSTAREDEPAEERRFLADLEEDVRRRKPRLVIVNDMESWYGLPDKFDTFEYLVRTGWTQRTLAAYRAVPGPDGWKIFRRRSW